MTSMTKRKLSKLEELSMKFTEGLGSTSSIIIHSILFVAIFGLYFVGVSFDKTLLILTTAVSLEAIYLAIFIQMTVNRNTQSLEEVEEDIEEIQEDVDKLEVEMKGIEEDVEDISEDIDKLQDEEAEEESDEQKTMQAIERIQANLGQLMNDIEAIKGRQ